jgi:hypothetical protein
MNLILDKSSSKEPGYFGDDSHPKRILSFFSPTGYDIQLFVFQFLVESDDIFGVVLSVSVQGDYDVSAYCSQSGIQGYRLPVIPLKIYADDVVVFFLAIRNFLSGLVSASVIDENDLMFSS